MTCASTVTRSSTVYRPSTSAFTASSSACGSASARNPTWPMLTPSMGTPAGRARPPSREERPAAPAELAHQLAALDGVGCIDAAHRNGGAARRLRREHPDLDPGRAQLVGG